MRLLEWSKLALVPAVVSACGGSSPPAPTPPAAAPPGVAAGPRPATRGIVYGDGDCARRNAGAGPAREPGVRQGGVIALAHLGPKSMAYVADADSRAVHVVDLDKGVRLGKTQLPGIPAQALVLADGRVAVTLRDRSRVEVLEPSDDPAAPMATLCRIPVAAEAWGIAASPDDTRIVVTSGWGARLSVLDGSSLAVLRSVGLEREPRAVLVDDDGRRAFVSHAVGSGVSIVDIDGERAHARRLELGVTAGATRQDGIARTASQGFALAKAVAVPDTKPLEERPAVVGKAPREPRPAKPRVPGPPVMKDRIYVPMAAVDPGNPFERTTEYYGRSLRRPGPSVAEPIVGVIDSAREQPMTRDLLVRANAPVPTACVLPRAAAVSAATGTVLVACLGVDAVVELDARAADPMRMELRRWSVPSGPTGIAVDAKGERAVVWSQFEGRLTVIHLADKARGLEDIHVDYTPSRMVEATRIGRDLFHRTADTAVSSNGLACASCHPEGRDDGLTWSTSSGPRQTLMLAGRMGHTAPYGWSGQRPDLPDYVQTTVGRLGGTGISQALVASIVDYLQAVPPPPTTEVADAEVVARGRRLFFDAAQGCSGCHVGGSGTDQHRHDVGSKAKADDAPTFDTPTLRFVRGTGPWFHDGRYSSLEELLAARDSRMGHSAGLAAADRTALAAYLESL